ncbi:MAG: DUF3553 domain-containing protein [Alphaproteobacteria bacterium]
MTSDLIPGSYVRHPDKPEWGLGQVQSAVGSRVTITFQHSGKHLIDIRSVSLILLSEDDVRQGL